MTGVTSPSFLTSDDPDLEDGEIASDDEGGKSPKCSRQEGGKEGLPPRERSEDIPNISRQKGERNDKRNRRPRPNLSQDDDEPEKKRKKTGSEIDGAENEDELLGLCVRGGSPGSDLNSPIWKAKATGHVDTGWTDDGDERKRRRGHSPSGGKRGGGASGFRPASREESRESRQRLQMKRKLKPPRKGVADKDVCLNYMKGACNKGADCAFSHNVCQPRKMELCKFYLKDCCMKRDKCLYLHEEFPCKFFHTGLKCFANKKCKFSHEPLNNFTRDVLLKHMETAPKDILGDFPRMTRENAEAAVGGNRFGPDGPDGPNVSFEEQDMPRGPDQSGGDFNQRNKREDEDFQRGRPRDHDERRNFNQPNHPPDFTEDSDPFAQNNFQGGNWRGQDFNGNQRRDQRRDGPLPDRGEECADSSIPSLFDGPGIRRRGDRQSPDVSNRFGRGGRTRDDGEDGGPRRRDHDDRRRGNDQQRGHGNRGDERQDGDGRHFGRNFGPDGPDNRNFNMGSSPGGRPGPQGRNFNFKDGPGGRGFNNDGPPLDQRGFDPESPRKRQFGPDNNGDNRFGPNDRGRNFGQDGMNNCGPNNFGPNNPNFGPGMLNNYNFGPNGPNGPGNFNFGPNNLNFGPNGPMFGNNDPDFRNNRDMNEGPRFDSNGPNENWQDQRGRNGGPGGDRDRANRRRRDGGHVDEHGEDHRRQDGQLQEGPGDNRLERKRGETVEQPDMSNPQNTSPRQAKPHFPMLGEDSNNSGSSNPFDFAKELAEYKSKQIEMEMLKIQQDEAEGRVVLERGPQLIPRDQREPLSPRDEEMPQEDPHCEPDPVENFPPQFTQVYPPFPSEEDKVKERKEGSSKRHHHKKKRKHSDANEDEKRKLRKERREKREKRQPVIVAEDGSFGGIKFKIKLNPGKEDVREVTTQRRPNEFMSSDDEIPLNYLQKRKDKEDGDETDTENRLVIETNEEMDEKPSPDEERVSEEPSYPRHLPKRQQELFMRIQSHQSNSPVADDTTRRSGSPGDRTPTPEPADENWYSSDDETTVDPESVTSKPFKADPRAQPTASHSKLVINEDIPLPPQSTTPPLPPPKIELAALKDLSKINITELLSSIRQITGSKAPSTSQPTTSTTSNPVVGDKRDPRARDPRLGALSPKEPKPRRGSGEEKPPYAKSIYDVTAIPGTTKKKDLDLRFRLDVDDRPKEPVAGIGAFGDVDLRLLGDGPLPAISLGLPFKPAPMHSAATEIEASLSSHPPIDYKVQPIHVPPPDFTTIKVSPTDPLVKKDPRLRRLFRVSSTDEPKPEEPKKPSTGPADPRRKAVAAAVTDTPKSPPDTPFSPPQEPAATPPRLTPNLLTLVQLGLSAAAGGAAFDPRLRSLVPQDLETLRAAVAGLRPEDLDALRAMEQPQGPQVLPDCPRAPGQGLLPTPPGMGLLPTPPNFMMNNMMPMDQMMGPMGPLGQPMPGPLGPMGGPMNQPMAGPMGPFGFVGDNDPDMRMFRGGFKGDRRGGRGNWRDRNWDNRRNRDNWDDRRSRDHRDRDDRREKRSYSPSERT